MTSTRTSIALSLIAASIAAGVLGASVLRHSAPAAAPAQQVIVGMQQSASGESVPTVTVIAKRMTTQQKARAALLDARDAAQAKIAGVGRALATHRA